MRVCGVWTERGWFDEGRVAAATQTIAQRHHADVTDPSCNVDRVDALGHNFLDIARNVDPGQWQAWLLTQFSVSTTEGVLKRSVT